MNSLSGGPLKRKKSVDGRRPDPASADLSPCYEVDFRDELVNLQLTDREQRGKPLEIIDEERRRNAKKIAETRNSGKGFTTANTNRRSFGSLPAYSEKTVKERPSARKQVTKGK